MNPLLKTVFLALASFACGALPFGLWIGFAKGVDVRKAGSGNVGAANVARLVGRKWGVVVFFLDALKGLVPTVLAGILLGGMDASSPKFGASLALQWLLISLCSVLGHNFSPFLGFRGGKGVATSLGICLGLFPHLTLPALASFAVWVIVFGVSRISSLSSLTAGVSLPFLTALMVFMTDRPMIAAWPFLVFSILLSLLLVFRHRSNIARLIAGTESRFRKTNGCSKV